MKWLPLKENNWLVVGLGGRQTFFQFFILTKRK
jgi:hypothetical protein